MPAILARVRPFPVLAVRHLVEITADGDGSRDGIENGEDADADHEPLEFIRARTVVAHHFANVEQRDESSDQERGADGEVYTERDDHEHDQAVLVLVPDVADAAQRVSVDAGHREDGDGLDGRDEPGDDVEVLRDVRDGLLRPFHAGR